MPTYHYLCQNCEAKTTTDETLKICPYCHNKTLKKGFSNDPHLPITHKSFSHDGTFSCCPCGKANHCK